MALSGPLHFSVVDFPEEKSCAVVSSSWLQVNSSTCLWPDCSLFDVPRLAKRHATPQANWKSYPYRLKSNYANYDEAHRAMIVYQYTSNEDTSAPESSTENKRRRTRPHTSKKKQPSGPSLVAVTALHGSDASSSESESDQGILKNQPLKSFITGIPCNAPCTSVENPVIDQAKLPVCQQTLPDESYGAARSVNFVPSSSGPLQDEITTTATSDILRAMQAEQRRSQQTMIDYLIKIVGNQEELLRRITTDTGPAAKKVELGVDIPVQTLEDFQAFNDWLGAPENLDALSRQLRVIGGSSVSSITQRVLGSIIANTVSVELSLTGVGTKTKAGLKGTFILDLIYDIVRNTKGGTGATNHDIDLAIQKWLKGASDRQGGRDQRRKTKQCGIPNQLQQDALNEQNGGDV